MSRSIRLSTLLLIFGVLTSCSHSAQSNAPLLIEILDVGQADSIVIHSPSGKTVVIDTGKSGEEGRASDGAKTVAPFLRRMGVSKIDLLLLSHPHADHVGGAADLLTQFPVDLLMDNGQESETPLIRAYLDKAAEKQELYRAARRGQTIKIEDGLTLSILGPTDAQAKGKANNASLIVRLDYGAFSALFSGDAEADEEAELVAAKQPLAATLYKVGHHGSKTSSTSAFLAAVHPAIATISCGFHNIHGHPNAITLEHLNQAGVKVYRTDLQGAIGIETDGKTYSVKPMREAEEGR